ncbi:MAG: cell wall hydrolase [Rhodospirillales bacterium]
MNPRTTGPTTGRSTARLLAAPVPGPCSDDWRRAVDVLARTIYGEARGELVRGKEAVACVIINRVRRARERGGYWWGGCVESVCKKPWQFSCWNKNDPNRRKIESVTADDPVFQSCRRIARRACAGAVKDPTGGAAHYHTHAVSPVWAEGKTPSAHIGGHLFYNDIE